jgi:hypothetical protein
MVSTRYRFRFSNGSRDGIRHKSRCSLGDFDRGFDPEIYKTSQYPIDYSHAWSNKTDLEKAFDYLIERKSLQ